MIIIVVCSGIFANKIYEGGREREWERELGKDVLVGVNSNF